MKIEAITTYVIKHRRRYEMAGQSQATATLPASDYLRFRPYPQLYSNLSEVVIVRVQTDGGIVGWGECQSPIGPEIPATIIEKVLAPAVIGADALATNARYEEMYGTLRVRGQVTGHQLDAIAGIDTALWDICGKVAGRSLSEVLGGRFRDELPCYVTGLRQPTTEGRIEEASEWIAQGFGIKPLLGVDIPRDMAEVAAIRGRIGDGGPFYVDGVWRYRYPEAVRVGRILEANGVEFFESPLLPEDIRGHQRLAAELDIAIAVGEPLRTRHQFLPWFLATALDIAQPDVMRNGPTEIAKIASLADAFNTDVALHTGCLTVVGMAATWHAAAAIPNFLVQEYQPVMLETFNPWLNTPLRVEKGHLLLPEGPGLGIEIDEERMRADVTNVATITAKGVTHEHL